MWALFISEDHSKWHDHTHIECRDTIADEGEADNVLVLFLDEYSYQCHVQDHTFHQHPHKGGEEEVMKNYGNSLTEALCVCVRECAYV